MVIEDTQGLLGTNRQYSSSTANKTAYVNLVKVQITEPDGNPADDNHFTFDTATPGVCNVTAAGTTGISAIDAALGWTLTAIAGSAQTSNPSPAKGTNITFTYTTLPSSNAQFGPKTLTLSHPQGGQATKTVEIFFSKSATNNPEGTKPNWYYYWMQTLNRNYNYNSSLDTSQCTVYSATNWVIEIGKNADWPGGNPPTGNNYIDGLRATIYHEEWHRDHRIYNFNTYGSWGNLPSANDPDGDDMATATENTIGTDPNVFNSTEDGADWAEQNGSYGYDNLDWASPGSQW